MTRKTVFVVADKDTDVVVLRPGMATMGRGADLVVIDRTIHYAGHGHGLSYDQVVRWLSESVDTRLKPGGVKVEF